MKQLNKQKFIEAKVKGKNNTQAALKAGAIKKTAAYKAGYRLNKDIDIQKRITRAVNKQGINLDDLLKIYTDATKAEKIDTGTGEVFTDHTTRMKAADKLLDLLGIQTRLKDKNPMSQNITQQSSKEIQAAFKA